MKSYDYQQRKGVEAISWERFVELYQRMVEELAAHGVDAVVGIARAGLFPATGAACSLRCMLYPVNVSRRVDDRVTHTEPVWHTDVSPEVAGKVVAVIDEIADSGGTLRQVAGRVRELGARKVVTAALVSHSWADSAPDVCPLVTDALVMFPWDQAIYLDGQWQMHPELTEALGLQSGEVEGPPV
jgi:hypoxanthine phosphoribosyltransferase